jgi:hypothetical protein
LNAEDRTPAARRAVGSDSVETGADGGTWIVSSTPKGWLPRRGRIHTSSEYPGTAVRWDGELFEVVEAVANPGSVRYRLEPWPDRHTVRAIETYDEKTETGRETVRAEHAQNISRRRLAILFSPLLGHLPGSVQERMESEFGAPAVVMTIVSALPLFALGIVSFLFTLASAYGTGYAKGVSGLENAQASIPHLLPLPLAVFLVIESGLRMGGAFLQARPVGSVAGTLLYEAWRTARGLPPPPGSSVRASRPTPERALQDRFRMLEVLLALLSPAEQKLLEVRYGMDILRWGRITAALLLAIGGLNVVASLAILAAAQGGLGDFLWLVAGAVLSIEQLARLRELARGRPAGSILGGLVRPLARGLLAR